MSPRVFGAAILALVLMVPIAAAQEGSSREDRKQAIKQCRLYLRASLEKIQIADYDSALVFLGWAGECDPKNPDVFYHTGRVLLQKADTTGAVSALKDGVETAPLSSRLKVLLARLQIHQGEAEEALALVEKVLAIKPREGEALYLKGVIHLEAGDSTLAMDSWHRALESSLEGAIQ